MTSTAEYLPFSLPRYPSPSPSRQASMHVLVTQGEGLEERHACLARFEPATTVLRHLALAHYPDLDQLTQALAALLHSGQVGLHLELHGDEAFIWTLHAVARNAGLLNDEIVLHCTREEGRTLFCVHCATLQTGTAATLQACAHCGVVLEVRRHFSERLGAYLGVCADADQPYAGACHE